MSSNKGNNLLTYIILILVCGTICFIYWDRSHKPKLGYIIIGEVFNQFDMKKDSERKFTVIKNKRQKILDSMALDLRMLAKKIDAQKAKDKLDVDSYNIKRDDFIHRQKTLTEDNKQLTSQYDSEIFTQINQYVKDFSKENGYQMVFGSDGNGSLMYGDDQINLTKVITEYINQKYKGK